LRANLLLQESIAICKEMFINNLEVFQTVTAVLIGGGELISRLFHELAVETLGGCLQLCHI